MTLDDYEQPAPTFDTTPRPNASQAVAAQKRALGTPTPAERRTQPLPAAALVAVALLLIGSLSYGLLRTPAGPLKLPTPTSAPTAVEHHTTLFIAPTSTAVPAPLPRVAPIAPQNGAGDVQEALYEVPPQTGRGLPLVEPAPPYSEVVGAQAQHVPRGGVTGPCDGACVVVPTAAPAMLSVIGAQVPHKVR